MKKISLTLLAFFMLVLTACGVSGGTPTGFSPNSNSNSQDLPIQTQILIGTFRLEKTDKAVSPTQAADLLPLWQVYRDLSTSDAAAQQEVDAVIAQIQETMTSDQMKAITDMKLTRQDIFTAMQDLGLSAGARVSASGTPQPRGQGNFRQGDFPQGGFQPGGFQGGGAGGGTGQGFTPDQIATAQARRAQGENGGGFNRIPSGLMDALIQLLQTKAGS